MDRKKRPVSGSEGFRLNEVKNREREDSGLKGFHCSKFSVTELILTDRRNISGTRTKSACGEFSVVDFRSQSREMPLPNPLNT